MLVLELACLAALLAGVYLILGLGPTLVVGGALGVLACERATAGGFRLRRRREDAQR